VDTVWQNGTDCAATSEICQNGACVPNTATQDVGEPCGESYGDCLDGLLCLGYQGFTSHCYAACNPSQDPFCQPQNDEVCIALGSSTEGYCEFGGDIREGQECGLGDGRECEKGTICLVDMFGDAYCTRACDAYDHDPGCPFMYFCRNLYDDNNPDLGYCW
jgi:hypothetical protein